MKKAGFRNLLRLVAIIIAVIAGAKLVVAAPPAQDDLAIISLPRDNDVIRGVVAITGSATHPNFQFYKVEYALEPIVGEQWVIIGSLHEQQVVDSQLELWDTTLVPDGSYSLRLRVVRHDGNYSEAFVRQIVVANAQPVPTPTPDETPTPTPEAAETVTPTPLPPTPTVVVEQPMTDTPSDTPPPPSVDEEEPAAPTRADQQPPSFFDTVLEMVSFDARPLQQACWFGAVASLGIFLLFGFLSALNSLIRGFVSKDEE